MTYPYNASGDIHLRTIIDKLRTFFPKEISIETIKKYGIANKGEAYIISTLKFINLIDESGMAVPESKTLFKEKEENFQLGFAKIISEAYAGLFDIHAESAWNLDDDDLIPFFRQSDDVSVSTGKKQAQTFKVFAEFAGKREAKSKATAQVKSSAPTKINKPKQGTPKSNAPKPATVPVSVGQGQLKPSGDFALSVRIEVNLPAGGTKADYDNIFKSIRENLINE